MSCSAFPPEVYEGPVLKSGGVRSNVVVFLGFVVIIFPTSVGGVLSDYGKFVVYGTVLGVVLLINSINKQRLLLAISCVILLAIFTLLNSQGDGGVVIRQAVPILCLLFVLFANVNKVLLSKSTLNKYSIIFMFILIISGYSVVGDIHVVESFFINYYAFGYEELAPNMYAQGKPVLFFISHSIAAISFSIIFFMVHTWATATKNKLLGISCYLLIPLILAQQSFTSYFMFVLVIMYLIILSNVKIKLFLASFLLLLVAFFVPEILNFNYLYFLGTEHNGFMSRYGSSGVYGDSGFEILNSPFQGKGLFMTEFDRTADSGVVNELKRGGLFYFILLKLLLYMALYKVTKNSFMSLFYLMFFFIADLAYAFTYSLRGAGLVLVFLVFLNNSRTIQILRPTE